MDSSQRVRAILSFVQAADAGSFAAAGRMLGITSAAVSKNVASLEKALGVRLMNRTTRALQLTNEGSTFLAQSRIALEALDTAVESVQAQRLGPSGRVRISTSSVFGHALLMPAIPGLLARYPALSVDVDFDDRLVDIVKDGYDMAIRGGSIHDSALISRPISRLELALVASPDYLARHGAPRTPQALRTHRLIARRFLNGQIAPWSFRAADGSITLYDPGDTAALTLSSPEAAVRAACAGIGIASIGIHLAWPHLLSGELKIVLLDFHHPGMYEVVLQYPHRALIAPRVRVTVDYLLEKFTENQTFHIPLTELAAYQA